MKEFKGVISILRYLILGILLVSLILPLIDGLTGLLLTMIEAAKGYFTVKITEYNCRLKKIAYADDDEEPAKKLIGFAREEDEEDYDEDE
jgi:hypothetical protein